MIVYSLNCSKGHSFDEWFTSSGDYDEQIKAKAIACPTCGDKKVSKGLMARFKKALDAYDSRLDSLTEPVIASTRENKISG